jgi:hypothetical protein
MSRAREKSRFRRRMRFGPILRDCDIFIPKNILQIDKDEKKYEEN